MNAQIREHILVVLIDGNIAAIEKFFVGMAQLQELFIKRQNRIGILFLASHIMRLRAGRDRQPWLAFREPRIVALIPLHGSALTVAAFIVGPSGAALGIFDVFFAGGRRGFHPDFLAVVQNRRAPKRQIKAGHQLCDLIVVLAISVAIVGTNDIVIADHEGGPTRGSVDGGNLLAEVGGRKLVHVGEQEIHGQLQAVAVAVIGVQLVDVVGPGFPDEHGVVLVGDLAQFAHCLVNFR